MPTFDIFSKRRSRKVGAPVIQQNEVPNHLRVQLRRVFVRAIGLNSKPTWNNIRRVLRDEWGVHFLTRGASSGRGYPAADEVLGALENLTDLPKTLDIIEICMVTIDKVCSDPRWVNDTYGPYNHPFSSGQPQDPDDALKECNTRMQEAGLGFRYLIGKGVLVSATSEYEHQQNTVFPLRLLREEEFKGAEEEFLSAHQRYRSEDYSGALAEAVKSLESTLKTICARKGWNGPIGRGKREPNKATLRELVKYVVVDNRLVTSRSENFFSGLVKTLEDGAGPLRNQAGGAHGSGETPVKIADYEAAYCLSITGAAIRFLVSAYLDTDTLVCTPDADSPSGDRA